MSVQQEDKAGFVETVSQPHPGLPIVPVDDSVILVNMLGETNDGTDDEAVAAAMATLEFEALLALRKAADAYNREFWRIVLRDGRLGLLTERKFFHLEAFDIDPEEVYADYAGEIDNPTLENCLNYQASLPSHTALVGMLPLCEVYVTVDSDATEFVCLRAFVPAVVASMALLNSVGDIF